LGWTKDQRHFLKGEAFDQTESGHIDVQTIEIKADDSLSKPSVSPLSRRADTLNFNASPHAPPASKR
jgi:hypothetical protein